MQFPINPHPKHQKFADCKQFLWSEEQDIVNDLFNTLKLKEEEGLPPNFFEKDTVKYLDLMRTKLVYGLLDDMPKGVLHHFHLECMEDLEFIRKYVLEYPGIYLSQDHSEWHYGTEEEAKLNSWATIQQARSKYGSKEAFQDALMRITQFSKEEAEKYSHTPQVWSVFEKKIMSFVPVFHQEDLYRHYMLHMAEICIKNGYQRVELRNRLFPMKKRNPQQILEVEEVIRLTENIEKEIQQKYSYFSLGLIPFGLKMYSDKELEDYLRLAYTVNSKLIVGFDMAQEEDQYPEFDKYQPVIDKLEKEYGRRFPGAYHAGQTKKILNHNIHKVVAYGSKRIGHGLNLFQHSYLIPELKQKDICIQICPLSNQFLGYVYNLTQHPAIAFYHIGLPISINPDDPARFGYTGTTPDFYVAAHAFGFDLKDMKLLGVYSILHALCEQTQKYEMLKLFQETWKKWIPSAKKRLQLGGFTGAAK